MQKPAWLEQSLPFLEYLDSWTQALPEESLSNLVEDPTRVAILSVDVTVGFCHQGPLASPRVKAIIDPIVRLFHH
ncbi:MAG: hypothetical protein PVJ32_07250, partial [Anaerolineales bacterium]